MASTRIVLSFQIECCHSGMNKHMTEVRIVLYMYCMYIHREWSGDSTMKYLFGQSLEILIISAHTINSWHAIIHVVENWSRLPRGNMVDWVLVFKNLGLSAFTSPLFGRTPDFLLHSVSNRPGCLPTYSVTALLCRHCLAMTTTIALNPQLVPSGCRVKAIGGWSQYECSARSEFSA